ncbi:N-acetyl-beta-glucosaminyl-glycoprotein 4-beta-N-acetylgalactosaminyltransferase 1 isoform X3 [Hydra vulgaris]|uniref:Beta-1,4-N-acetylgalactosaminyltransferase n=1 Tax=Hydra vulgaris TaxID=6087 RepID=A0ABM4CSZ3_HYDVU
MLYINTNKEKLLNIKKKEKNESRKMMPLLAVKKPYKKVIVLALVLSLLYISIIKIILKVPDDIKNNNVKYDEKPKGRHVMSIISNNENYATLKHSVNVHYWYYICGYTVEDLRSHPLFPYLPFHRDTIDSLHFKRSELQFGARIFGYIHPPIDGFYIFAISSNDCSELWLSSDTDPLNLELLAQVGGSAGNEWSYENQFDKYPQQKSMEIQLYAGKKYFFDVLWKQERAHGHIQVVWKNPIDSKFQPINGKYLSRYYDDTYIESGLVYLDHLKNDLSLPDLPSHIKMFSKEQNKKLKDRSKLYERDSAEFLLLPHIDFSEVADVLSTCDYHPSWIIEPNSEQSRNLGEYEGVHLPHYYNISTRVFPKDQTWNHTSECVGESLKPSHCQGNEVEDNGSVNWTVDKYMKTLRKKFHNRFKLHSIVNVENAYDSAKGNRFLIELALEDSNAMNQIRRLSVYVFRPLKSDNLCYPKNFQWNKNAMVHLILTVKNQGAWVQQYVESLSNIYAKTKDENFNLIIIDFESFDVNITELMKRSILPHWQVITQTGRFHKTSAIQNAINSIKEQDSIALQTDLHLEFPLNFIDDSRKHCVQGKMGYTPLLMRLACGRYIHNAAGFWEAFGYGIFGIFKSDWDYMGGMDVEKFQNKWGGEDWDFADRVIKSGLEIERLRVPYFFHYFHTKKGMWDNSF